MISIHFDFGDLHRNLMTLSRPMSRRLLRESLTEAAEPIRRRMSQLAPVSAEPTQHLKDKIAIRPARGEDIQEVAVAVGPTVSGYYGSFQELGTAFYPAQPFARPAFDEGWFSSLKIFASALWRELAARGRGRVAVVPTPVIGGPRGGGLV